MKTMRRSVLPGFAIVLALAAGSAAAQPVPIAPRIQLGPGEFARVQAYASQGPEALRRFLWRTRMIYNYSWDDLVAPT